MRPVGEPRNHAPQGEAASRNKSAQGALRSQAMLKLALMGLMLGQALLAQSVESWPEARAVLERHCIECHHPGKLRGGLDLSTETGLNKGGKHGAVLDRMHPMRSALLQSVRGETTPRMPWKRDPLRTNDIVALEAWIKDGASMNPPPALPKGVVVEPSGKSFWSFQPLTRVKPPDVVGHSHPIDALLSLKLSAAGLGFAAPAEDAVFFRRANLVLHGLPPSVPELEAFMGNGAADKRARLIDALLASPHFGERMARHWLDVARYADSNGYEFDEERPAAWPYRDFVVKAMNDNMPADQFIRWQIAGDELAGEDRWARAGTGFLAAGPVNGNEENEGTRYTELDDVLATTTSAFLGLTLACARCHDHKFDPLTAEDYYALLAGFVSTRRVQTPFAPADAVAAYEAARKEHEEKLAAARRELELHNEASLARIDLSGPNADEILWRCTFEEPPAEWLLPEFDDSSWKLAPGGFGTEGTPGSVIGTRWDSPAIWLRREFIWDADASELALVAHHDDDVHVYLNGTLLADARGYVTEYKELPVTDFGREKLLRGRNVLMVHCRQDFGGQFIDVRPVLRSELRTMSPREAALRGRPSDPDRGLSTQDRKTKQRLAAAVEAQLHKAPPRLPEVMHLEDSGPLSTKAWLLRRGNPEDKVREIDFAFPAVLPQGVDAAARVAAVKAELPGTHRRAALAAWLTDVDHGVGALVARVLVNRVWQWHFGLGLVATPSDFGTQGARPTHPELLDWLAGELVSHDWDLKHIHRLIATSHAWGQSSHASAETLERDPDGALLSRRTLQRLDGEVVRDAMLAISGCLNRKLGGPAVKPWVHADVIATGSTQKWPMNVVDGPQTWRRSLYVFMRRSVRFPFFEVFDAPDAQASCGRRVPTVTPLQSLAMMNNAFVRDQAARFAARVRGEQTEHSASEFATKAMRAAFQRAPSTSELAEAVRYLTVANNAESAQADFCQALFGSNAFLYLE